MSLVDVKGVNLVPGAMSKFLGAPWISRATLDADGELCGCVFEIPKTGNISKIGIMIFTVVQSDTLKVSLQTVDTSNGRPTGTLIHADAYGTQSGLVSRTTYWVSLQNPVAVTKGLKVAIVVEFDSYVAGNLSAVRGISVPAMFPYTFQYVGAAWTFQNHSPNFGLEYDDGTIGPIVSVLPAVNVPTISWDTNDNPDRRGLRFSVPYNCRLSGISIVVDLDGDADIEIYDNDGTTLLETISLDSDLRGSTSAGLISRNLITPIELTKDTFYRAMIHPTTGTNVVLYALDVIDDGGSKAMNAIDGGVNFHYTTCHGSPNTEGDYTQTLTRRPLIVLMIDQLESADYPVVGDVRDGTDYNNATQQGVLDLPAVGDVEKGVQFDNTTKTGTFKEPGVANVEEGVQYGAGDTEFTGTFAIPSQSNVRLATDYGASAEFTGSLDLPAIIDVEKGVQFDSITKTGTFKEPGIANVKENIQYGAGDTEFTGTYVRNVIKIATQLNYDQYNIAITLDSDPSIQVTVEDYNI